MFCSSIRPHFVNVIIMSAKLLYDLLEVNVKSWLMEVKLNHTWLNNYNHYRVN